MKNYEKFKEKAEAVSGVVKKIQSHEEALSYVENLFLEYGFKEKKLAVPEFDEKALLSFKEIFNEKDIQILKNGLRNYENGIEVGLTYADFALADTGSLVINSKKEDIRFATMITNIHVAVVNESRIKENTDDIENELTKMLSEDAGYVAFITGASRTADIERVLALGVHGPLELHILVMEDK